VQPASGNGFRPADRLCVSPGGFLHSFRRSSAAELPDEELAAEIDDLPTYVLCQIAPELAAEDRLLAHILTSLDEDGLLSIRSSRSPATTTSRSRWRAFCA
jgi:hypothetical protein